MERIIFFIEEKEGDHIQLSFTFCEEDQIEEDIAHIAKAYEKMYK